MALSSLKCNVTISFVYVKSGGRIMQISGRSYSLCIFLYEMEFSCRFMIFHIGGHSYELKKLLRRNANYCRHRKILENC